MTHQNVILFPLSRVGIHTATCYSRLSFCVSVTCFPLFRNSFHIYIYMINVGEERREQSRKGGRKDHGRENGGSFSIPNTMFFCSSYILLTLQIGEGSCNYDRQSDFCRVYYILNASQFLENKHLQFVNYIDGMILISKPVHLNGQLLPHSHQSLLL